MVATYRIKANEITEFFIKNLQDHYRNKEIEITVQEIEDETDYLLKTNANSQHLIRGIKEINSGIQLQAMTINQLEQFAAE